MRTVFCIAALFLAAVAAVKLPLEEKTDLISPSKETEEKPQPTVQAIPHIAANKIPERDTPTQTNNQDSVKTEPEKVTEQKDTDNGTVDKTKINAEVAEQEEKKQTESEVEKDVKKEIETGDKETKVKADATEEETKVKYNGVKVLRVVVHTKEHKKFLRELENNGEIQTWLGNGTAMDILIKKESAIGNLKQKQLSYDVVIDDLQKAIDEENPTLSEEELELQGKKVSDGMVVEPFSPWHRAISSTWGLGSYYKYQVLTNNIDWFTLRKSPKKKLKRKYRLTWQMYHRMTDIHDYLDFLVATHPQMCSVETIGQSVEGRPLKVLKISSGQANSPAMWVDAGIHAREWITPATATYIMNQMVEGGDGPQGVDWYFQPLVNPDGYEHSHKSDRLWRKNRANPQKGSCAGTDLNRNFGYRWGGQGASKQPCRETYAGTGPFSEPETAAINKFITSKNGQVKAYVSLHSYGQYILYPWGYDRKVPPDYSDLDRVGREMAQAIKKVGGQSYTVGSAASTLYPASGGSDDWAKGTAKVKYSYTLELRDTGRHGFVLPAQYIIPTAKEAYSALRTLAREVQHLRRRKV